MWAHSTPVDADCWIIKAGRTGSVQVPKGTKKVEVLYDGKVDLDVFAMAYGVYSKSAAYWGIRAWAPNGAILSTITLPNGAQQPIPGATCDVKFISAKNAVPEARRSLRAGQLRARPTGRRHGQPVRLRRSEPPRGRPARADPYTGGMVDADVSGVAVTNNLIQPRKLKVSFYR